MQDLCVLGSALLQHKPDLCLCADTGYGCTAIAIARAQATAGSSSEAISIAISTVRNGAPQPHSILMHHVDSLKLALL